MFLFILLMNDINVYLAFVFLSDVMVNTKLGTIKKHTLTVMSYIHVYIAGFWVEVSRKLVRHPRGSTPWRRTLTRTPTTAGTVTMTIRHQSLTISLGDRLRFSITRRITSHGHYFDFHIIKLDTLQDLAGIMGTWFFYFWFLY